MSDSSNTDTTAIARRAFEEAGLVVVDLQRRQYLDEEILLVSVNARDFDQAGVIAQQLDTQFSSSGQQVLTTVRRVNTTQFGPAGPIADGVHDSRAITLRQLISSRARTSEAQPSLSYIPDAAFNINAVATPRHQLIFGRRGAGKTALMVEAKRVVESEGAGSVWLNVQTYRREESDRIFLYFVRSVMEYCQSRGAGSESAASIKVRKLVERTIELLDERVTDHEGTLRLIPVVNDTLKHYLDATGLRLFAYLDDFYYIPRRDQPVILDMMHACVRDSDCWLKVASIRNLTKWFITSPPIGLETGHDADLIDLDITLQDLKITQAFLERVLLEYAHTSGIGSLSSIYSKSSLDRLTLASGGVPRDYLVLAGAAIVKTRERSNSKLVGVQDVNQAAGDAAQIKVQELEEDGSSNKGVPEQASRALVRLRSFCLDETSYTYFRVRHQDRDNNPEAFGVLNRLVEFRLLHSIAPSVSNPHRAGDASEVFMLDLSQYTGSRLKQKIWVLEIADGNMYSKRTRDTKSRRTGGESRDLIALLRLAPELQLKRFSDLVVVFDSIGSEIVRILKPGMTRTAAELVSELGASYRDVITSLDDLISEDVVVESSVDGRPVFLLSTDRSGS